MERSAAGPAAPALVLSLSLLLTVLMSTYVASRSGPMLAAVTFVVGLLISAAVFQITRSETRARAAAERLAAELRQSESAMREREGSFRLLFEANPLPMWVYDVASLSFLEVNAAAVGHYGYTREEFLAMRLPDLRPAEEQARLERAVAELASSPTGQVRRYEQPWRHRLKDGRIRDVEILSHTMEFAGRGAVLVVATDVTDLVQAQTALARYADRLGILHEIDQAITAAKAPEAIAEVALRRLRDLLGVTRAIVNMFDLATGEVEWLAAAGRRRIRVGPGVRFSITLMGDVDGLKRGELQVIDVDALPPSPEREALLGGEVHQYMVVPMIANGELMGGLSFGGSPEQFPPEHVAIAREVATELAIAIQQARLYERVKRQTEELEQRVEERTLELRATNGKLQQEIGERRRAEEEAARANRAKSDFLSRMSHELRTPMNGILGFAQLLEMEPLPGDQRESVDHILRAGRHLLGLINEVLDISRIEAGRLEISLEPVAVDEIVQRALDLVRPLAAERGIELPREPMAGGRYVLADRQRLQQVLLNLLSNAVKYNRPAGSVKVACADLGDGRLAIRVSDTGSGIAPGKIERLFTPFDRLGAEGSSVEGTGLGLTLSKHLVDVMGGALQVESEPGVGSTFSVELARADSPVAALAAGDDPVAGEVGGGANGVVLYIEDNLANLTLIERVLARRPQTKLLSALQGQLGLDLAREHRPDLIILDLHLPDLPGEEVLARLAREPRTRHIPVVVLSADATPGQIERLLAAGARAYLTKPLDVPSFLKLLDESLPAIRT